MIVDSTVSLEIHPTAKVAESVHITGNGQVRIGKHCTLERNVLIDSGSAVNAVVEIGDRSKLKYGTVVRTYNGSIRIGKRVSVGEYCVLAGHGGLTIEDAVIVAGHCYFSAADHIFDSNIPIRFQGESVTGITIEFGAWIGAHCTVLDAVSVGKNTVVGAGSVVTKTLRNDKICFGVPCIEIRDRFDTECTQTIED